MKTFTKEIPIEIVDYIEGLEYDVHALQDLIAFLGRSYNVNKDLIKDYQKDYLDKYAEFEKAKSMFIHDLEIDKLNNVKWELDYNSQILTVTYEEKT